MRRSLSKFACAELLRLAARRFLSPPANALLCTTCYADLKSLSLVGNHRGVISLFLKMLRQQPSKLHRPAYLVLLKSSSASSLYLTTSIHGLLLKLGFTSDVTIATALISTLFKCSDIAGARRLFDEMTMRDVPSWNAMLSGYSGSGFIYEAFSLFHDFTSFGLKPNLLTLSTLLQLCRVQTDEQLGMSIHAYIIRHCELSADIFFYNSLIVFYNKFDYIGISQHIFKTLPERNLVSWNAMISGYAQNGMPWRALELFYSLRDEGVCPDHITLETVLQACANIGKDAKNDGLMIHGILVKLVAHKDVYSDNSLLLMYCKSGDVKSGQLLFDRMEERNLVSWSIIIYGNAAGMYPDKALHLFKCMLYVESKMSSEVLVSVLQAVKLLEFQTKLVMSVHGLATVTGFASDKYVISSLMFAYGDSEGFFLARDCLNFVEYGIGNVTICWNTMLSLYVQGGHFNEAIDLIFFMQHKSCSYDVVTLVNVLSICIHRRDLKMGKVVHGYIIRNSFDSDAFLNTSLIELYWRCGCPNSSCWLFLKIPQRTLVTWNVMIHGSVHNGMPGLSLKLFHLMQEQEEYIPDETTLVGVLEAIAQRGYLVERNYIHNYLIQSGSINNEFVASSLISLHARFNDLDKANTVFHKAKRLGTVVWNTMIAEYCYNGISEKALSIFFLINVYSIKPDSITILCLLKVCADLDSLVYPMWAHAKTCKLGHASDVRIGTTLIDLYAKGGDLGAARSVFDNMVYKTVVTWNSMIRAYGMHGNAQEVSNLFSLMQKLRVEPTMVTFLILLSVCSHCGDLKKGQFYLDLMAKDLKFFPRKEHISSLIDFLGRRGLAKHAYKILKGMSIEPEAWSWGALLQSCQVYGDYQVGFVAVEKLLELDSLNYGYFVLSSNLFAEAGRWFDASVVRSKVEKIGTKKMHGWSKIYGSS